MTPRDLQTALAAEGYNPGVIDGLWGDQSIAALTEFQADHGLSHTGVADAATLAALDVPVHQVPGVPSPLNAALLISSWEQTVLTIYFDGGGVATIGDGHAILDENGHQIVAAYKGDPKALATAQASVIKLFGAPAITKAQALSLLSIDINHFAAQIAPYLNGVATTQAQLDAMLCLSFNIGARGFGGSTVLLRHKAGVPVSANINVAFLKNLSEADKMDKTMEGAFAAWSKDNGQWVLGLFRRRLCEAMVYRGDSIDAALAVARVA